MTDTAPMLQTPRPATGAEIVCEVLAAHRVDTVFGYAGGAVLELYDAIHRDPRLRHLTVRHEQAAAHAAAGQARASGRAGVCIATSGPGATNLITGIMDAHMDSTPMVVLTGQVHTALIGYDAFQEADLVSMTAPVTKRGFQPRRISDLGPMLEAAFHIAESGRPGPVLVDLPKDVLMAPAPMGGWSMLPLPGYLPVPRIDPVRVAEAVAALQAAERPLMLLGGGAVAAGAGAELCRLAERFAMPIVTTITAKGLVPETHPLVHGMIGMYGRKSGVWGLQQCDLLLACGSRFTDRVTGDAAAFAADKTIVHLDIEAYELGKNVPAHVPLHADVRDGARALLAASAGRRPRASHGGWQRAMATARDICTRCIPHPAATGLHPHAVMQGLDRIRRSDDIVTTGVGQHQMFAAHFLTFDRPRTFITSAGAGTMGYGLPAAIGALTARPGAHAFVVDGDGSFQMTLQELATVAQEHLPITILILDNGQLGMVRQWQDAVYAGRHEAVHFRTRPGHPDFVQLAGAYGIPAENVQEPAALEPALAWAAAMPGPTLLRIAIDPAVDNAPMMPAGSSFAAYSGGCVTRPGMPFVGTEAAAIEEARRA